MYPLRSFHPRHMTACGAVLRRLGTGAITLQEIAHRLVRHLCTSFTRDKTGKPACVLVRLFKTTPYGLLTPDLQALADQKLQPQQPSPSLPCLTLFASAGIHPGWNDPTLFSRFRVLPLNGPDALERLPMFQQLFRQLGFTLPHVTAWNQNLLLDPSEHSFNVLHVPEALGSPHVPVQEEFVRRYGIRSVLGFGAPLSNGDLFSIILFSKDYISEETAQLFKPLALCTQIALAPHARPTSPAGQGVVTARSETADLEQLLAVHEQTVNAQAERLELIVKGSQMGTWDWHVPSGHITFNERWAAMIGYHLDELEPHVRTWEQLVHPDDLPAVMAAATAHLRGETPAYSTEYRLRSKSGAWRWVFDSGRVVERDARGAPLRATGVRLDISDRKELEAEQACAQRALQVKQAALDEAQTLAHLGSWEWEIASGAERWSDEQYRIFGLAPSRTQSTYATFLTALHPDDRKRVEQAVTKTLIYDTRYNIECRIIRPNGELRYIHLRGIVHRQADGSPVGMSWTVQDITEYKRAESAWRDSETRMRSIFESAIEGIVVINERGQIETANLALLKLLGYEAHEFIGKKQELSAQGIECLGAETGQAAVELAHTAAAMQKPFDLALVELHLTDLDGFETARALKQHPSTAGMRLVIRTTVGRRGDGATAQAPGIDAYLTKPIRQSQLLEWFSQLLGVTVPAASPKAAAAPPLITRHTLTETQRTAVPRLLLAEDNPVNQKVACKMLEKLGYRVDVAGNGQEAVAAHERAPYPLIFMDCQMPEVDGFEATALIRKMEGKSARTPIIAMTANAMQGDRERCLAAGMDDYVAKPIRPKELQAVLETWLENRAIKTGTTG